MAKDFHEHFASETGPLPSERSTGLVFAGAAVVIAVLYRSNAVALWAGLALAVLFLAASLLAPRILKPLNIAWFRFALLLNKFVSPGIMLILFAISIVPFGLAMQLKHDPLRKRRLRNSGSYWIERDKGGPPASMTNQF